MCSSRSFARLSSVVGVHGKHILETLLPFFLPLRPLFHPFAALLCLLAGWELNALRAWPRVSGVRRCEFCPPPPCPPSDTPSPLLAAPFGSIHLSPLALLAAGCWLLLRCVRAGVWGAAAAAPLLAPRSSLRRAPPCHGARCRASSKQMRGCGHTREGGVWAVGNRVGARGVWRRE